MSTSRTRLNLQHHCTTLLPRVKEAIKLTAGHLESFEEIKRRFCAAPRLAHPYLERPSVLYTDASKSSIGAVLLQRDNSAVERVISFCSKKLSPAQRNHSTYERECLPIICALEHFRVYLLGRKFRLRTDHRALAWLFSKEPKASARISGWLATLMEYPIVIEYARGSENSIANALSLLDLVAVDNEVPADLVGGVRPSPAPSRKLIVLKLDLTGSLRNVLTVQFRSSPILRRRARLEPADLELNPQLKPFADVWPQLVLEVELVKHCNERAGSTRVVVPAPLREEVFRLLHEPAHHGFEATLRRI